MIPPPEDAPIPASLVVPSRRLARALRARHAQAMRAAGHDAWRAPEILPFDAWLLGVDARRQAAGAATERFVLSAEQEQAVWARVIDADGAARGGSFAPLAQAAWLTLQHWLGGDDGLAGPASDEQQAFRRWRALFVDRCRDLGCIDRTRLLAELVRDPAPHWARLARGCRFRGFHRPSPLLRRVPGLGAGTPAGGAALGGFQTFATAEQERDAAVRWALAARAAAPAACIAIACPDPAEVGAVAACFERHLAAACEGPGWTLEARPFRADAGRPLDRTPLVATALDWLGLAGGLERPRAERLCVAPHLGGARAEHGGRARLAAWLHAERAQSIGAEALAAAAGARPDCADLAARAAALVALAREAPRRQPASAWMVHVGRLLNAAGWPGSQPLAPLEEEALRQWEQALDTVASLDAVQGPVGYGQALARLEAILQRRRASAPAAPDAIEILTVPEAAALAPERVWILGLCDSAWPPRIETSPLLPYRRLRAAGVPGADAAADLLAARTLLAVLAAQAGVIVASHAAADGDTPLRPCPLLPPPAAAAPVPPVEAEWQARAAARGLTVEAFGADPAPPLSGAARGGAAVLADQAACPFRAFARHRLAARTEPAATPGLDRPARGSLVHQVLARLWAPPASRAGMAALVPGALQARIAEAVDEAIAFTRRRLARADAVWALERERLLKLVSQWLDTDLAREDFEVVACEEERRAVLGGLELRLRVDRVDRLADGSHLIVDYKTGQTAGNPWFEDRPDQPQLPLYALTETAPVGGIAFARVRAGDCGWREEPRHIHTAVAGRDPAAWALQMAQWRATLEALASDFVAGGAPRDPKRGAVTCRQCDLAVLCRIHESAPLPEPDDDE